MADLEHVRWIRRPELRRPHVIAAFTGWNDAADAASTAVKHLVENLGAAPLAEIVPEEFTDFRNDSSPCSFKHRLDTTHRVAHSESVECDKWRRRSDTCSRP